MRRWLFVAILTLLIADASGLISFVGPENCKFASVTDQAPDGCPAFCARCSCCAIPIVHATPLLEAVGIKPSGDAAVTIDPHLPPGVSLEVFHIPKTHLA
jgi:hypothetical protein